MASKAALSETAGMTTSIGILWQYPSGADVDGQGEDATKHAIARKQGWRDGFILSDVDPDFDNLDPIKALKELN